METSILVKISRVRSHKVSGFSRAGVPWLYAETEDGPIVMGLMRKPEGGTVQGDRYRLYGRFKPDRDDPTIQVFHFNHYETMIDASLSGMTQYLYRHVESVGRARAKSLVDHFGAETIAILRENAERATEVRGITPEVADAIRKHFRDNIQIDPVAYARLVDIFAGRDIPQKLVMTLLREFGSDAPAFCLDNPYKLLDYPRMGWVTVDKFAVEKAGYDLRGIDRQREAIKEALTRRINEGHTTVKRVDVDQTAFDLLLYCPSEAAWEATIAEGDVCISDEGDDIASLDCFVAPIALDRHERNIARHLERINARALPWRGEIELPEGRFRGRQSEVLELIRHNPVCMLTGLPGVGKTSAVAITVDLLNREGVHPIIVESPTGMAAKKARDFIDKEMGARGRAIPSTTIHTALGIVANTDDDEGIPEDEARTNRGRKFFGFEHHEHNPLMARLFIIDECFPAGTLIDTPIGRLPIESIGIGSEIFNAWGVDRVISTSKKEVDRVVRIQIGEEEIFTSENHRFFTSRGLVFGHDLRPGDSLLQTTSAMRLLRDTAYPQERRWSRNYSFLQSILQHEMAGPIPRMASTIHGGTREEIRGRQESLAGVRRPQGQKRDGENQKSQSDFSPGSARENFPSTQVQRVQAPNPRGKWQGAHSNRIKTLGSLDRIYSESYGHDKRQAGINLPVSLQVGSCGPRKENLHRSRRRISQSQGTQGTRQEERRIPSFKRVDRVEILEQGDHRLDRFRDESGKLYFYDLQAARHQSFSVNSVLVHNCSMVDTALFDAALSAVPNGARVLLVGDPGQLPSVGPGSVQRDLLLSGIPALILTEILRSDGGGGIVRSVHAIHAGRMPQPDAKREFPTKNYLHIEVPDNQIAPTIVALMKKNKETGKQFHYLNDTQVISPQKDKHDFGCKNLNEMLSLALNPPVGGPDIEENGAKFRIGDKVIRRKNARNVTRLVPAKSPARSSDPDNIYGLVRPEFEWRGKAYDLAETSVVNGDIGIIEDIVTNEKGVSHVIVRLGAPDRLCRLPLGKCHLERAYAITCHLAQGSGYPYVICPLSGAFAPAMWCRELVTTMLSRATTYMVTVGRLDSLKAAIGRKTLHRRKTRLCERIAARKALPKLDAPDPFGDNRSELIYPDPAPFDDADEGWREDD